MQEEAAPVLKMAQGRILMVVRRLKVHIQTFTHLLNNVFCFLSKVGGRGGFPPLHRDFTVLNNDPQGPMIIVGDAGFEPGISVRKFIALPMSYLIFIFEFVFFVFFSLYFTKNYEFNESPTTYVCVCKRRR